MEKIDRQDCPLCLGKTLTLSEEERDIDYFGKTFIFSMNCSGCGFNKSDIESLEKKEPVKITFTIEKEKDMNIRVVKSSNATIKIPQMRMSVEPGVDSIGYVSNIEGLLKRFEDILIDQRDNSDEDSVKKHAKNLLKKMRKVKIGDVKLKIIVEDPSGNSAILDKRAEISKLK